MDIKFTFYLCHRKEHLLFKWKENIEIFGSLFYTKTVSLNQEKTKWFNDIENGHFGHQILLGSCNFRVHFLNITYVSLGTPIRTQKIKA